MKNILIVSHAMELGGAETALLGLLENLDYSAYNVDLFLLRHQGELMKYIPEEVHLLPEDSSYNCLAVPIKEVIKKGKLNIAFHRYLGKKNARRKVKELGVSDNAIGLEYSHKYTEACMPMISDQEYDLAISFLTPHYFVRDKVKAKKKIAWIHTDYSKVAIDVESEYEMWKGYDHIAAVSEGVSKQFIKLFPSLEDKVCVIENILPERMIKEKAEEPVPEIFDRNYINLLSVGRFSYAKNYDNVPDICRRIIEKGLTVKWYLIGYGNDEELIRNKINEAHMEGSIIILGKKENPYPYIKACDCYVQPSRYEGKAMTVKEAQMLGKPVIITAYSTSGSQLRDGYDGVIVPMDNEGCAEAIYNILQDKDLIKRLSSNCLKNDYSNRQEIQKIDELIER